MSGDAPALGRQPFRFGQQAASIPLSAKLIAEPQDIDIQPVPDGAS